MTVAVITDSAAALPTDLATGADIAVVPMWLTWRGRPEPEGTRPLDELVTEDRVTTSAPTPGEWAAAINDALRTYSSVLVCTIASTMSATHQAAVMAAGSVDAPVRVVDTLTAAGGEALVVIAAANAAQSGADLDECEARALHVRDRVRLVATLGSLDHLVRSGRVPGIAGWAGKRLGINPLFEFRDGKIRRLRPALSPEAALDRMVGMLARSRVNGGRLHVVALHALALPAAQALRAQIEQDFAPATSFIGEFGPVMVVHTGPGLSGLAWWWEEG